MALTVRTNVASLNAQRNLGRTQHELGRSLARLSSGLRINTAADDAAGLAISEKLQSHIRSLGQAERNANDATSMLQTAEGAFNEISGILVRMRELAIQSATDTVGSSERSFLDDEYRQLWSEIDRIVQVTEFNGKKLLGGASMIAAFSSDSNAGFTFQVGIGSTSSDQLSIRYGDFAVGETDRLISSSAISLGTLTGGRSALLTLDSAISDVSGYRAQLGATTNRLQVSINNLSASRENLSAANSRIRDADVADETAALTRSEILMQAGISVLAQANQQPALALSLLG